MILLKTTDNLQHTSWCRKKYIPIFIDFIATIKFVATNIPTTSIDIQPSPNSPQKSTLSAVTSKNSNGKANCGEGLIVESCAGE